MSAARTGRRGVITRHEVTGILEAVTALRVGGWGVSAHADLVVARDGLGRVMIPGTSLAGALRAWLGTVAGPDGSPLFGPAALGKVFGDLGPEGQGGQLCRIRVDDAVAAGDVVPQIRDGVGIGTGTAAAGVLYQHEVVPPGTRFAMRVTASQARDDPERAGVALRLIIAALAGGGVELGAARTRGLGRVRLTVARHAKVDLTDRDQVLAWLCGRPAAVPDTGASATAPAPVRRLSIEISWSPVTPVMVQASTVNEPDPDSSRDHPVDTVPLRTSGAGRDGPARLLLPGSSVKGVLRSHAERIMRTLLGVADLPGTWLDQVNDARLDPVGALFGVAADHSGEQGGSGRRGALSVQDCHGDLAAERVVTHVAVDRWTGGAAENLLFSVCEPADAAWEPIRMSLDIRRVPEGGPGLALLLLVLRDLADGWLAVGFGGTRGRGAVSISQVTFSGSGLPEPWAGLCGRTLADLTGDPSEGISRAFASWQEAVAS
jgi:CRISPR/Cas system CSM-associated protein Csm3 (group 7 of RAMP superfamily)